MITCIIAEKPSVARDIARIVGANCKQDGYLASTPSADFQLEGNGYLVTWAMGHLIALAMPDTYGFSAYKAEDLPIRPNPFQLVVRQVRKDKEYVSAPAALKQLKVIRSSVLTRQIVSSSLLMQDGRVNSSSAISINILVAESPSSVFW